jgi:GPI-anchor transamidase subunit S
LSLSLHKTFLKLPINHAVAVKQHKRVHITFSLLVEDNSVGSIEWPAQQVVDKFFDQASAMLGDSAELLIDSQVLPFAHTSHRQPKYDHKSRTYFFLASDLPHFVNSNEWKLETTSTKGSTINFLLFIPSEEHAPLQIRSGLDVSTQVPASAFIVPQWGGVYFFNSNTPVSNGTLLLTKNRLQPALAECLILLRQLLGLPEASALATTSVGATIQLLRRSNFVVERFELDSLLRSAVARHLASARATLSVRLLIPFVSDTKEF